MREHLEEAGYCVVPGLLTVGQVGELRAATERYPQELRHDVPQGVGVTWDGQDRIQQIMHAERLCPALDAINRSEALLRPVRGVLGYDVGLYHSKFILKDPGGCEVPWHQDYTYWVSRSAHPCQVNCMVYLDEADEQNGCLLVAPGSHHGGLIDHQPSTSHGAFGATLPCASPWSTVALPGAPGDAVFFGPLLHHASGANRSSRPRHSFTTVYTNPLIDVHREVLSCFFPRERIKAMSGPGPFRFCAEHYHRRNLWHLAADHVTEPSWDWVEISDRTFTDGSFEWLSAHKPPGCTYVRIEQYPLVTSNRDDVLVRSGGVSDAIGVGAGPFALVVLDCERTANAEASLRALAPGLRQGTVIVLDRFYNFRGWERGGYRAFQDFVLSAGWGFDYLGRSWQQVVVRVTDGPPGACPAVSWQPVSEGVLFG